MQNSELISLISKQTGIPEKKVRQAIYDYCRDIQTVVSSKATGGFRIPNIGYLSFTINFGLPQMRMLIDRIERKAVKNERFFKYEKYRFVFTRMVDEFYAVANVILENQTIKNEEYNRGAGSKRNVNMETFKGFMVRMDNVLSTIPAELRRAEYSEIQKICLCNMQKQGFLLTPGDKDCKVQPMRLCNKG